MKFDARGVCVCGCYVIHDEYAAVTALHTEELVGQHTPRGTRVLAGEDSRKARRVQDCFGDCTL